MTPIEEHMVGSAFLLGKLHTGLFCILNMKNTSADHKLEKLAALEADVRAELNKLYYPNPAYSTKEL